MGYTASKDSSAATMIYETTNGMIKPNTARILFAMFPSIRSHQRRYRSTYAPVNAK